MSTHVAAPVTTDAGGRTPRRTAGRLLSVLAIVVSTIVVVAAGIWGLTAPREAETGEHTEAGAAVGEWVEAPGGYFRVDAVGERALAHKMIGMDPDPVPEGFRRLGVDVTLVSTSEAGLNVGADRFTVVGHALQPAAPLRARLDAGLLAEGSQISGSLVFEVPEGASGLQLRIEGGSHGVALPVGPPHAAESTHHGESPPRK